MPPFQYTPFIDPYVGTIAGLIGSGQRADAEAAERIGDIRALEAQQRGQAWSGAIGTLGNLAAEYMSPEARRARELEKAQDFLRMANEEARQITDRTYQPGSVIRVPGEPGPPSQMGVTTGNVIFPGGAPEPVYVPGPEGEVGTQMIPGHEGRPPTEAELDILQSVDPEREVYSQAAGGWTGRPDVTGQPQMALPSQAQLINERITEPVEVPGPMGEASTQRLPGSIEETERTVIGRFTTPDGFHDLRAEVSALQEAGFRPDIIRELISGSQQTNALLEAYDARVDKSQDATTVLTGQLAADVLNLSNNGVLPLQEAIDLNLSILERRFSKEALNNIRVHLHSLPEDQRIETLQGMADAADRIVGPEYISPEALEVGGATGRITQPGALGTVYDDRRRAAAAEAALAERGVAVDERGVAVDERLMAWREAGGVGFTGSSGVSGLGGQGSGVYDPLKVQVILDNPALFHLMTPTERQNYIVPLAQASNGEFNFGQQGMTPSMAGGVASLSVRLEMMEALDATLTQQYGFRGKMEGLWQRVKAVTGEDADHANYLGVSNSILPALARSSGEVGNLADKEVALYNKLQPQMTDPINVRRAKYAAIRYIIDAAESGATAEQMRPFLDYMDYYSDPSYRPISLGNPPINPYGSRDSDASGSAIIDWGRDAAGQPVRVGS